MNELQINNIETISSREVAEMMGKEHKEIMWMIEEMKNVG